MEAGHGLRRDGLDGYELPALSTSLIKNGDEGFGNEVQPATSYSGATGCPRALPACAVELGVVEVREHETRPVLPTVSFPVHLFAAHGADLTQRQLTTRGDERLRQ